MISFNKKIKNWLKSDYVTNEDKDKILNMKKNNPTLLKENFKDQLKLGTGGLRAIMDIGTNKMNIYTVSTATQALANYLKENSSPIEKISVIIGYDTRLNSQLFAQTTANVLSANGIKVYISKDTIATPQVSYLVRHLKSNAGVMITASHNPKEYNGFKIFDATGAQPIHPTDQKIIKKYKNIKNLDEIQTNINPALINKIEDKYLDSYYQEIINALKIYPSPLKKDINITYTSLHGVGSFCIPKILKKAGFNNINLVEEQSFPDGHFPNIPSPNPEDDHTFDLSLNIAKETKSDIIIATDPDVDRLRIAVKNNNDYTLLNGNQLATIILSFIIEHREIKSSSYIIKTIVTSNLLDKMCEKNNIACYNTLTGFKYIGDILNKKQEEDFLLACEESCGYLISKTTRDKDAISTALLISSIANILKEKGISIIDYLIGIYKQYQLHFELLHSVNKNIPTGEEEIKTYMNKIRKHPPHFFKNNSIVSLHDYASSIIRDYVHNSKEKDHSQKKSNVIVIQYNNNISVTIRPSGTEPKIKFYFSISKDYEHALSYKENLSILEKEIKTLKNIFSF